VPFSSTVAAQHEAGGGDTAAAGATPDATVLRVSGCVLQALLRCGPRCVPSRDASVVAQARAKRRFAERAARTVRNCALGRARPALASIPPAAHATVFVNILG
jgi:hypothetical protein